MKVIDVEPEEDDLYGIIVQVREGKRKGYVPPCDFEVTSSDDRNFWPVRDSVIWFANRDHYKANYRLLSNLTICV